MRVLRELPCGQEQDGKESGSKSRRMRRKEETKDKQKCPA
jgi:hypothetical protein